MTITLRSAQEVALSSKHSHLRGRRSPRSPYLCPQGGKEGEGGHLKVGTNFSSLGDFRVSNPKFRRRQNKSIPSSQ